MRTLADVALDARGVTKSFPGVRALNAVDLSVLPGRVHALLGENGAGKSTLVKILTGNQPPDSGEILLAGVPTEFSSPADAMHHGISAVYQELTVLPDMTVLDNVMLGHDASRRGILRGAERKRRARAALDRVALEGISLSQLTGDLSLANQQLVEIARAILRDSTVLILDEPSAVLSGGKLAALHAVVRSLASDGTGVIYITHLLDEVQKLADDVTILRDGTLVSTGAAADYPEDRIIREMIGRTVESVFPDIGDPGADLAMSVRGLTPSRSSARSIDLDVRRGEVVGLAGLVGSGRSRLLRTIAGVRGRSSGFITVGHTDVRDSIRSSIASGIAFVPEERKAEGLVLDLTVSQNATLPALRQISTFGWINIRLERDAFSQEQARLGIKSSGPSQVTRELSGGNQQKIVIGKWLRVQPTVLLLDEPTRGVDVGAKTEIYRIIHELAEGGMGIILASSELTEVIGLSHRVLVCRDGSVVGEVEKSDESPERIMMLAMGVSG